MTMSLITKKTKVKQKFEKSYIPHKIRSHPFYFIHFPLLAVLVTMFYWLILGPLLFAKCLTMVFDDTLWPVYFWVTAFIVYLILIAILVCYWRCSCKKKRKSTYEITVEDSEELKNDSCIELKDMSAKDVTETDINANDSDIKTDTPEQNELFPRCSVRQKKRPQSLALTETRPVSQNVSSPLTPRELFFIDLIEGANKTCSSTAHSFLENEKLHYSPDDPLVQYSEEDKPSSPSEFFIANVPVEQTCTTQMFLYVDEDSDTKPQIEVICDAEELEFNSEPECLACNNVECPCGQTVDSIRHLYLGRTPRVVKQCVRCGGSAGTVPVTRTAAIRAWDQRWLRSCQCGGLWRMQVYS